MHHWIIFKNTWKLFLNHLLCSTMFLYKFYFLIFNFIQIKLKNMVKIVNINFCKVTSYLLFYSKFFENSSFIYIFWIKDSSIIQRTKIDIHTPSFFDMIWFSLIQCVEIVFILFSLCSQRRHIELIFCLQKCQSEILIRDQELIW